MKKLFIFAAACVALVACNNKDNALNGEQPNQPKQKVTISATINLGDEAKAAIRMIQPNASDMTSLTDGKTINFHWEEGDSVTIRNDGGAKVFKLVKGSISADGKSANFDGEPLDDMTSYNVNYRNFGLDIIDFGTWGFTMDPQKVPVFVNGTGNDDGFTLDTYASLLRLPLTGTDQISKIAWNRVDFNTNNIFSSSVQLSSTATVVYLPCLSVFGTFAENNKLSFYDASSNLIMEKSFTADTENWSFTNSILTFPELEVKEPTLVMTPAKYQTLGWLYSNLSTRVNNIGFVYGTDEGYDCYYVSETGKTDFGNKKPYSEKISYISDRIYYYCYIPSSKLSEIICSYEDNLADSDGNVTMNGHTASFFDDGWCSTWAEHLSSRSTLMNTLPYVTSWMSSYTYYFNVEASAVAGSDLVMLTIWNRIVDGI